MRLLETRTGNFVSIDDPRKVRYAILSHVWAKKSDKNYTRGEQTYQEVCRIQRAADSKSILPKLSRKIRRFCEVAFNDGFELGWADSCCIDQSSSAELSEAINSMYNWYSFAGVCYAFLHDFDGTQVLSEKEKKQFHDSEWFRRGWTLQELIAPIKLIFLSKDWKAIGSKRDLARLVEKATNIERAVLTFERPLEEISVARRMSWAAGRKTSQVEDQAYSLMGIFGVTMPVTYGEGRSAFIRLQEEILKLSPDQTIFAWGTLLSDSFEFTFTSPSTPTSNLAYISAADTAPLDELSKMQCLLASSPNDFASSRLRGDKLTVLSRGDFLRMLRLPTDSEDTYQRFQTTAHGMRARLPLVAVSSDEAHFTVHPTHIAPLACRDSKGRLIALLLRPISKARYLVGAQSSSQAQTSYCRVLRLSPKHIAAFRDQLEMSNIYIHHRAFRTATHREPDTLVHDALWRNKGPICQVRLCRISRDLLERRNHKVLHREGSTSARDIVFPTRVLSLSSTTSDMEILGPGRERIVIKVGLCNCAFGTEKSFLGVLVLSEDASCSLVDDFSDEPHPEKHPAHIRSWNFHGGIAWKDVKLKYLKTGKRATLRLTFARDSWPPQAGLRDFESTQKYVLEVEMYESGPQPRNRQHTNHSRASAPGRRSKSQHQTVLDTPPSSTSSSRVGDDGAYPSRGIQSTPVTAFPKFLSPPTSARGTHTYYASPKTMSESGGSHRQQSHPEGPRVGPDPSHIQLAPERSHAAPLSASKRRWYGLGPRKYTT